jgi:uncharacterized membrane protein
MNEIFIYLLPIVSLAFCYLFWLLKGRDDSGRKVIVPEYEPPLDLSPGEVGLLQDFSATDREITATLVDLAIRGYIRIRRISKKHIYGNHYSYQFELLKDDVLGIRQHEKALLNGLFGVATVKFNEKTHASLTDPVAKAKAQSQYPAVAKHLVGAKVKLKDLNRYFYQYVNKAKEELYSDLNSKGYFKSDPLLAGLGLAGMGLLLITAAIFSYEKPTYLFSSMLSGTIFLFFSVAMQSRSKSGTAAKESLEGFRMYLHTVETHRFRAIQAANSAEEIDEKVRLFEKYLPYAIALGLESSWTKQFKKVYNEPLKWFDQKPAEEVIDLVRSIHASYKANR